MAASDFNTSSARAEAHPTPAAAATAGPILFSKIHEPFGFCSNFSPHPVRTSSFGVFRTSEHFFQATKFLHSPTDVEEIRKAGSPMSAATCGRSRSRPLRPDWERVKDDSMELALLWKFTQHADILTTLLSSGNRQLVEHTARDSYWGDGGDGGSGSIGKNMLGRLLGKVRDFLRDATPSEVNLRIRALEASVFGAATTVAGGGGSGEGATPAAAAASTDSSRRGDAADAQGPKRKVPRLQ